VLRACRAPSTRKISSPPCGCSGFAGWRARTLHRARPGTQTSVPPFVRASASPSPGALDRGRSRSSPALSSELSTDIARHREPRSSAPAPMRVIRADRALSNLPRRTRIGHGRHLRCIADRDTGASVRDRNGVRRASCTRTPGIKRKSDQLTSETPPQEIGAGHKTSASVKHPVSILQPVSFQSFKRAP
jgi:hypothetical protein